jgi:hypothetical protein
MYLYLVAFTFEYSYFKAMNIIAKLSFWILQPRKKRNQSLLSCHSSQKMQPFEDLILGALDQFRTEGYVEKLKTSITPESLPSNKDDLLEFLYNQIAYT